MTFFEHTEIPAGSAGFLDTKRQILPLPTACQLPTRLPGLRYLDQRFTDFENVTDTDVTFQQTFSGKVFSKTSGLKIDQSCSLCPIGIVFGRIDIDGLFGTTVVLKVRLPITVEISPAQPNESGSRLLKKPGPPDLVFRVSSFARSKSAGLPYLKRDDCCAYVEFQDVLPGLANMVRIISRAAYRG